jgi:hypothetical protein
MSAPDAGFPAQHRGRHISEPVEMSAAEKLACEREARHDVVGRRRFTAVAPVQQYLTHTQYEGGHHSSDEARRRSHADPDAGRHGRAAATGLRSWVRWGEDGGPGNPVIPRC